MASKIKLKPNGTPPYWDGKGFWQEPEHPIFPKYFSFILKFGNAFLRFPKRKSPLNSPFGYYKNNSYFPSLEKLKGRD